MSWKVCFFAHGVYGQARGSQIIKHFTFTLRRPSADAEIARDTQR